VALWLRRDVSAFTTTYNLDESRVERPEALPSAVRAMLERCADGALMAVKAGGRGQMISVTATITGVEKTSEQFKLIRRDINRHMRDVMERVGDQELLPLIRADFPRLSTPTKYVQAGVMASEPDTTYRERSGVFIGSRLAGPEEPGAGLGRLRRQASARHVHQAAARR
jgi:hypothetical protein